jgi:hypothetical protein
VRVIHGLLPLVRMRSLGACRFQAFPASAVSGLSSCREGRDTGDRVLSLGSGDAFWLIPWGRRLTRARADVAPIGDRHNPPGITIVDRGGSMTEWTAQQIPAGSAPGKVILFEGMAFCVCAQSGDMVRGGTDGIFFRDTRIVSRWELKVDEEPLEPLALVPADPFSGTFLSRSQPRRGRAESSLLVTRARYVAGGMREDITVENATAFDGRLPELFCGFDRMRYPKPVPYPTSCSPQAWAAASPVHLLRVLLRFDPWIPYRKAWIAPTFPPGFGDLRIEHLRIAGEQVSIYASGRWVKVRGWPEDIELINGPRPPLMTIEPPEEAP